MMDEQIIAAVIRANKTKTFTVIEPLYFTCTHFYYSLARKGPLLKYPFTAIGGRWPKGTKKPTPADTTSPLSILKTAIVLYAHI
jgi:hypothetical protein